MNSFASESNVDTFDINSLIQFIEIRPNFDELYDEFIEPNVANTQRADNNVELMD